jgi:aryl-alcohol dehydrogenase-like predicted oxidoreductase
MRTLGATGLKVSSIGLGLAALGRPGYINLGHANDLQHEYDVASMETNAHRVLDAAWKGGIRYFDAARSYGLAEQFLASWLTARGIPKENVSVGSKWGYEYTADWKPNAETHEVKKHSIEMFRKQWNESSSLLGDQLDLYQLHSATVDTGVLENQQVLKELFALSQRGIRVGLTLSGIDQAETLRRAMNVSFDGIRLFQSVQATWNILERSAQTALEEAQASGMGVIVKEALANGRLTSRNTEPAFAKRLQVLEEEAKRFNTTIDALCIAAVLENQWVDVVLSGATSIEQVESNLTALELALDEEAVARLRSLKEVPEVYWATRANLKWN